MIKRTLAIGALSLFLASAPVADASKVLATQGDISLPKNEVKAGPFTLNYDIHPTNGTATVALTFNKPNTWFGVAFGENMAGSDFWSFEIDNKTVIATDRFTNATNATFPLDDESLGGDPDVILLGYQVRDDSTVVKVSRLLETGDKFDTPIKNGVNKMLWAHGTTPGMKFNGNTTKGAWEWKVDLHDVNPKFLEKIKLTA